jgi:hypothetical protein
MIRPSHRMLVAAAVLTGLGLWGELATAHIGHSTGPTAALCPVDPKTIGEYPFCFVNQPDPTCRDLAGSGCSAADLAVSNGGSATATGCEGVAVSTTGTARGGAVGVSLSGNAQGGVFAASVSGSSSADTSC